ncbi:hypothetical protein, partial [Catenulispora pinisilvae]|uniref:hypothetical protein n=1 Tax=Catenulispora pinisilvae TaxID=2705253 RepID=UPI001891EF86
VRPPSTSSATQPGPTCDQTFQLVDFPGDPVLPIPDATAASALCHLGVNTLDRLLPGHTWGPGRVRIDADTLSYVPDSFTADGYHTPGAGDTTSVAVEISPRPVFSALCSNVWYPQTTCRDVTLADGTPGIEFDSAPSGDKPGGYTLYIDLPGGRQFQFAAAYQAGGPQPVTLDGFLTLIKSSGFVQYVEQYKVLMGTMS